MGMTPDELRALQETLQGQYFLAPWDASPELLDAMDRHIQSRQWPVLRERCLKAVKDG
jgi:hypothetical protein